MQVAPHIVPGAVRAQEVQIVNASHFGFVVIALGIGIL